jgi:hypothetical protein
MELAQELGVCRETVYSWIASEVIPKESVRRDLVGRYWFHTRHLEDLKTSLKARSTARGEGLDSTY